MRNPFSSKGSSLGGDKTWGTMADDVEKWWRVLADAEDGIDGFESAPRDRARKSRLLNRVTKRDFLIMVATADLCHESLTVEMRGREQRRE